MKKYAGIFVKAILAGFCIGLGGTVFLRLKDAFTGGNVVGALLFTVGLFLVCTRGYSLFTGKVCYLFDNPPSYLLQLAVIWLGNFVGIFFLGYVERATGICGGESGIDTVAAALVESKLSAGYLSLFLLGCLCNVFIFIAVDRFQKAPSAAERYLALFLGVSIFILCGTEHCVADMYYWAVSGLFAAQPAQSLLRLLVITAGNVVGGVFLPLMERLYRRLEAR